MSTFSLRLETRETSHKRRAVLDKLGRKRTREGERRESKYSHKLTKVDTGTDVFDKFPPLLCMSKCEPDGSEQ